MKVTDIKAQVKTPGRYSVYIDGKFAFGLSELGLINSGLRIGHELAEEAVKSLRDEAKVDKAHSMVLALISRRPRSRWEIEDYLKRKGYEPETVELLLNMLSNRGYVDDESFAKRWIDNRRLFKPISKRKLQLELKQKRISEEIINSVLASDEADEIEVLKAEITRKQRQTRYQDEDKLIAYLARQGYGYGDIKQAFADLAEEN